MESIRIKIKNILDKEGVNHLIRSEVDDLIIELEAENKELREGISWVQVSVLEMEQSGNLNTTQVLNELEVLNKTK